MDEYEIKQMMQLKRHILAIACGIVGGSLPNTKSNMHPYLSGALVAAFLVKVIYGDYDKNYTYTFSDIVFWIITICEGIFGAYILSLVA